MSQPLPPWLTWLETCDSTNTWAYRHSDRLHHGQVIYTRNQTHGRGQYGRRWRSGGFTASFVLAASPAVVAPSLVAGLAVAQAVESLIPLLRNQLQLKWPNDIMAQGKKLAGILCEHHQTWLVVGVGLNRSLTFTENELPQAISLHALIAAAAVPTELDLLVAIRDELLWCWESSIDWLSAANQRDFLQGRSLQVLGQDELAPPLWQGKGAGINAKGHLKVRLASGKVITVASGHVIYNK